jgi:hypothetical protein
MLTRVYISLQKAAAFCLSCFPSLCNRKVHYCQGPLHRASWIQWNVSFFFLTSFWYFLPRTFRTLRSSGSRSTKSTNSPPFTKTEISLLWSQFATNGSFTQVTETGWNITFLISVLILSHICVGLNVANINSESISTSLPPISYAFFLPCVMCRTINLSVRN